MSINAGNDSTAVAALGGKIVSLRLNRLDWTVGNALGAVVIYILVALLSLQTASLHLSTAAVWIPSGLAIALVAHFGVRAAPSILIGSLVVNAMQFLFSGTGADYLPAVAATATIAIANMLEALIGGYAMRRVVKAEPLANPRATLIFLGLVVAIPAAVSAGTGTAAIWAFDKSDAAPSDIFVTWYFANATGALIVVPSVLWLLRGDRLRAPLIRPAEFIVTLIFLVILLEALVGAGEVNVLAGWPNAYTIWPVLILVCFRYGERELFLVLILSMAMAVAGTMRGFAAFPAETERESLTLLQIFLGITSGVCYLLKSSLNEAADYRWELQRTARLRLLHVDRLLAERDVIDTLMVHDLHSPLSGVRGAIDTAIATRPVTPAEFQALDRVLTLAVSTCDEILDRLKMHLTGAAGSATSELSVPETVERILRLHRLAIEQKGLLVVRQGNAFASNLPINGASAFLALEVVIDNAIAASPVGGRITIDARLDDAALKYVVSDDGPGIPRSVGNNLFSRPVATSKRSNGIGLFLAREALERDGGHIAILDAVRGATISLVISRCAR
jgi:integral membrane sensor domain MASE1